MSALDGLQGIVGHSCAAVAGVKVRLLSAETGNSGGELRRLLKQADRVQGAVREGGSNFQFGRVRDFEAARPPGQAGQSPVRWALSVPAMRPDCGPAAPAGAWISLEMVACMVVAV